LEKFYKVKLNFLFYNFNDFLNFFSDFAAGIKSVPLDLMWVYFQRRIIHRAEHRTTDLLYCLDHVFQNNAPPCWRSVIFVVYTCIETQLFCLRLLLRERGLSAARKS